MKRSRFETEGSYSEEASISSPLYVHLETLKCAEDGCVPCLHKIFPSGYHEDIPLPTNVRPEICPRSKQTISSLRYYSSTDKILTLGDGDMSFSRALAKGIRKDSTLSLSSAAHNYLIATTHESRSTLLGVYPQFLSIANDLSELGVEVRHEVDGTNLRKSFTERNYSQYFDYILWNFPCVRMPSGSDGQVSELDTNKLLLRGFFGNCAYLLKSESSGCRGGEVHVAHKTIEPFSWWGIEDIAKEFGFRCVGHIVFDKYLYPGYSNKKVLDNKSFPLHDARVSL